MRGVKAPTAQTKASWRGRARSATDWALVVLATSGQAGRAASGSSMRRACRPRWWACATSASALAGEREAHLDLLGERLRLHQHGLAAAAQVAQQQIGLAFKKKDHTTVLHAQRKIAQLVEEQPRMKQIVDNIEQKL